MSKENMTTTTAKPHAIGHRIQTLLGPYADAVENEDFRLIFGGAKTTRSSRITGAAFIAAATILYLFILLRMDGWLLRIALSLLATAMVYLGLFLIKYYHAVIFDQEERSIFLNTRREKHRFAAFGDVKHFKDTEHRQRGRYRATTLSIVLKDGRELRFLTYKKQRVEEGFQEAINKLLWLWLNGYKEI